MPIIAFSGKIGSGKTSACKILREKLGLGSWEIKSFANKLREHVAPLTGHTPLELKSHDVKNEMVPGKDITIGTLLQQQGQLMRETDPNYWIDLLLSDYDPNTSRWLIDDLRFKNEADALHKLEHSLLIRLDGDPSGIRSKSTRSLTDQSEIDLDDCNMFYTIISTQNSDIQMLEDHLRRTLVTNPQIVKLRTVFVDVE